MPFDCKKSALLHKHFSITKIGKSPIFLYYILTGFNYKRHSAAEQINHRGSHKYFQQQSEAKFGQLNKRGTENSFIKFS